MSIADRAAAFFHWLGTPIRATRALFPFSHDGRQTLIYVMCAGSAPVLTATVIFILNTAEEHGQWGVFAETARIVAYSLLIISCAFAMFVAFRSLSLGNLLNLQGKDSPDTAVQAAKAVEQEVKDAAKVAVERVEAGVDESLPDYAR